MEKVKMKIKRHISLFLSIVILVELIGTIDLSVYANDKNDYCTDKISTFDSYYNMADDFDFLEYLVRHYTSDEVKNIIKYRTNDKTNCQNLVEYLNGNGLFQLSYAEWEAASFITNPSEIITECLDKETYYETILLRVLNSSVTSDNAIDWLNQGAIKNSVKMLKNITKFAEVNHYTYLLDSHTLISDLSESEVDKITTFSKNYVDSQPYKIFNKDLDFISDLLSVSKDVEQYSEKLASYCQLMELGDAVVDYLGEIKSNTSDKHLEKAIDRIIPIIEDSYISMLKTAVADGVITVGETALKKIVGDIWKKSLINLLENGVLYNGTVIVNSTFLAIGITKLIGNIAFSTDAKLDKYELMKALCSFEETMNKTICELLNDNRQVDNYSNLLLESVAIFYQTYIVDTELQTELIKICKNDWVKFTSNQEFEKLLEISKNNKEIYKTEYDSITIKSGACGNTLFWVITNDCELIVYGIGDTYDYTSTTLPWKDNLLDIKKVYISSFTNKIGTFFLYGLCNVNNSIAFNSVSIAEHNLDELNTNLLVNGDLKILGENKLLKELDVNGSFTMDFVTCTFSVDEGATLNVKNNIFVSGGYWGLRVPKLENKGIIDVGGDANFEYTGHLIMHTESAKFNISGDFSHGNSYNEIDAGTVSVNGDINSTTKFGGTNTLVLNGDEPQNIIALNAQNLKVYNTSVEGVTIVNSCYVYGKIQSEHTKIINGKNINLSGGQIQGCYLGDLSIDNIIVKNDAEVKGNLYVTNDCRIASGCTLTVEDFTMDFVTCTFSVDEGATLNVKNNIFVSGGYWGLRVPKLENKGTIDVGGNANFEYTGHLIMHTESAKFNISGDFSHGNSYNEIDAGTVSVNGDINSTTKFGGTNTLVLNGDEPQNITALNAQNLKVYNTSVEGVTIVNSCYVYGKIQSEHTKIISGKNINLSGGQIQGCYLGDLSVDNIIVKNDAEVKGNLYITNDCRIASGCTLTVEDFTMDFVTCTFSVDEGATLNVKNNIFVSGGYWGLRVPKLENKGTIDVGGNANFEYTGHLIMHTESAKFNISGDFSHGNSYNEIDAGTVSVNGDINSTTKFGGTNTLVLNGDEPQTINASDFSTIEICNSVGVVFNYFINVNVLFNHNGNKFELEKGGTFVDYDDDGLLDNVDPYPAQVHYWQEISRVEATCTSDGYYILYCSDCDQKKKVLIKRIEHNYILTNHINPTFESSGYDEYKCTACSNVKKVEIKALDGSALEAALDESKKRIESGVFTDESVSEFRKVYDKYKNAADEFDNQKDIDVAVNEITTAYALLVIKDVATGTLDNGMTWTFTKDGAKLSFAGEGEVPYYAIGSNPWYYCGNIETLEFGEGITSIAGSAFTKYNTVKKINFPSTLTTINIRAFEYCYAVEELVIPDSVTFIGYGTFASLTSLKRVTVPASVGYASYAFEHDEQVEKIIITPGVDGIMPECTRTNNIGFFGSKYTGAFGPWRVAKNAIVTVQDGITSIGLNTFYNAVSGNLTINIPASVNNIGKTCFTTNGKTVAYVENGNCVIDETNLCLSNVNVMVKSENGEYAQKPHTHTWSDWHYNNDAVYNSSSDYKDGTQTCTCSVCGESETKEAPNTALLRRRGNALSLESSITLATYITKDVVDYYDEVYAEFTRNGKIEKVYPSDKTLTSNSTVYCIFDYTGISPQALGDNVSIIFYGIKDGVKYNGNAYKYSATEYIKSTLKSTTSAKLKTLLVDLVYYGEACQVYQNYKTDNLLTDILTDEQKAFHSTGNLNLTNIKNSKYRLCDNRLVKFGTALRLNNSVKMAIAMNMTNVTLEELSLKVKKGSRTMTYSYSKNPENFGKGKDGYWYFYFDGVYANQMSDEVLITAYKGSEQVSYTLKYSVESYAAIVTDAKIKAVTDAMMRYGNSAKAYVGK